MRSTSTTLPSSCSPTELGFDAVVVNEHHNTAYSMMAAPNLIAAAIIPQIKNAKICVWGTPPNLEYPEPPGGRIRDARRDVGGPPGSRVSARHRHGILGQSDQSGDARASATRSRSRSSCRPGRRTARPAITAISTPTATSIRGRGLIRSRIRRATSSAPAVRKPSNSRPSSASATPRCSSPSIARPSSIRTCAGLRAEHGHQIRPDQLPLAGDRLCRRDQGKGRARSGRAHPLFLRGRAAHHADFPGAARLSLGRSTEKARGARGQAARRASTSTTSTSSFFVAVGTADQVVEQLEEWGETDGHQPLQHPRRHRRHAALEGSEESEFAWRRTSSRACAPAPPRTAASPPNSETNTGRRLHGPPGSLWPDSSDRSHTVNGVKTVVLTAGHGEPLVFLHGAGTWHGLKFALPWAEKFRVIIPFHPGSANPATIRR